jgi:aryl-alcohol dehydrogenase-like predicted oxidoreductase
LTPLPEKADEESRKGGSQDFLTEGNRENEAAVTKQTKGAQRKDAESSVITLPWLCRNDMEHAGAIIGAPAKLARCEWTISGND